MKKLSRDEMKKVMGGFAPPEGCVAVCCSGGGGGCEGGYGQATFYAANCEDASAFCSNSGGSVVSCVCRPGGY